jgi:hypothetical protein
MPDAYLGNLEHVACADMSNVGMPSATNGTPENTKIAKKQTSKAENLQNFFEEKSETPPGVFNRDLSTFDSLPASLPDPIGERATEALACNPTADSEVPPPPLPPEIQTLLEKWPKIPGNIRKIIMALAEAEDPK